MDDKLTHDDMLPENDVEAALDDEKLTLKYWAKKLKSELNAKKTKTFKGSNKDFSEDGKLTNITEEVIYSKPMIAWPIRQKARQDLGQARGVESAKEGSPGKLIVEVVQFKKGDYKKSNEDT